MFQSGAKLRVRLSGRAAATSGCHCRWLAKPVRAPFQLWLCWRQNMSYCHHVCAGVGGDHGSHGSRQPAVAACAHATAEVRGVWGRTLAQLCNVRLSSCASARFNFCLAIPCLNRRPLDWASKPGLSMARQVRLFTDVNVFLWMFSHDIAPELQPQPLAACRALAPLRRRCCCAAASCICAVCSAAVCAAAAAAAAAAVCRAVRGFLQRPVLIWQAEDLHIPRLRTATGHAGMCRCAAMTQEPLDCYQNATFFRVHR